MLCADVFRHADGINHAGQGNDARPFVVEQESFRDVLVGPDFRSKPFGDIGAFGLDGGIHVGLCCRCGFGVYPFGTIEQRLDQEVWFVEASAGHSTYDEAQFLIVGKITLRDVLPLPFDDGLLLFRGEHADGSG